MHEAAEFTVECGLYSKTFAVYLGKYTVCKLLENCDYLNDLDDCIPESCEDCPYDLPYDCITAGEALFNTMLDKLRERNGRLTC